MDIAVILNDEQQRMILERLRAPYQSVGTAAQQKVGAEKVMALEEQIIAAQAAAQKTGEPNTNPT